MIHTCTCTCNTKLYEYYTQRVFHNMHFTHADRISYGFYIMNSLPSAQKTVHQNFAIPLKNEVF